MSQIKSILLLIVFAVCAPTGLAYAQSSNGATKLQTVTSYGVPRSFGGEHVLINLYISGDKGPVTLELANYTQESFASLSFQLSVLGGVGKFEFSNVATGASTRQVVNLPTIKELSVREFMAFNSNADERHPNVYIQYILPEKFRTAGTPISARSR